MIRWSVNPLCVDLEDRQLAEAVSSAYRTSYLMQQWQRLPTIQEIANALREAVFEEGCVMEYYGHQFDEGDYQILVRNTLAQMGAAYLEDDGFTVANDSQVALYPAFKEVTTDDIRNADVFRRSLRLLSSRLW